MAILGPALLKGLGSGLVNGISSGTGGAIKTAITGSIQKAFTEDLMDYQANLAEEQAKRDYERQLDFFNKQNEYNTPEAQYKRLQDAGLNPSAVLSGGGLFNTSQSSSSAPTGKLSSVSQPTAMDAMTSAELDLVKSQTRKNNADAGYVENGLLPKVWSEIEMISVQQSLLQAQTSGILTDNEMKDVELYVARSTMDTQIQYTEVQLNHLTKSMEKLSADTKLSDEMRKFYASQSILTYIQAEATRKNIQLTEKNIELVAANVKSIMQHTTIEGERWTIDSKFLEREHKVNLRNSQWNSASQMVSAIGNLLGGAGSVLGGAGKAAMSFATKGAL